MKKTTRKKMALALAFAVTVSSTVAMDVTPAQAASKGKVTSVKVTNLPAKTLTIKKGKKATLKVKVATSGKSVSTKFSVKSSNTKVATVKVSGKNAVVTGKKNGKATVTITSKADKKKNVAIKVTVGTPVTKVSLKKTASVTVGKKITLKATITPKKPSNKTLIWKSSNKKIATVSSRGVVTGVKAGTANITATAADGSGKKATCKVTVKAAPKPAPKINITKFEMLNSSAMQVTLSGAQTLSASDFVVKVSLMNLGTYNKVIDIESISTADKKTYTIGLKENVYEGQSVQVSIPKLTGTKTAALRYWLPVYTKNNETVMAFTYNETVNNSVYVGENGYSQLLSIKGLPAGMKAKMEGSYIAFSGKPTVKGLYNVTYQTKDERGNIENGVIHMMIGSTDKIVASSNQSYHVISNAEDGVYIDKSISATGGSGSYTYSIVGTNYGLEMNGRYVEGYLKTAGTYKINVKVADYYNSNLYAITTVVINVKQGIVVSGLIKDATGATIPYASIELENKNRDEKYVGRRYASTGSNGTYSTTVVPGTYDVHVYKGNGEVYKFRQTFTTSKSGVDVTIPVYKIAVVSSDSAINADSIGSWYDADGNYMGSGSTLYLKKGTYNLTSEGSVSLFGYKATLSLTVSNTATVKAKVTRTESKIQSVAKQDTSTVLSEGKYLQFTPTVSGTYYFYATNSADTNCDRIILYQFSNSNLSQENSGWVGNGTNSYLSSYLTAGKTYYYYYSYCDDIHNLNYFTISSVNPKFKGAVTTTTGTSTNLETGKYAKFVPTVSGNYEVKTTADNGDNNCDNIYVYDADGAILDYGYVGNGNTVQVYLAAGNTYYLYYSNCDGYYDSESDYHQHSSNDFIVSYVEENE